VTDHPVISYGAKSNNKFELILTRRAKAYSTSCSQIALVYLQPFRLSSLLNSRLSRKLQKKTIKCVILGVHGLSKSSCQYD